MNTIISNALALAIGLAGGYVLRRYLALNKKKSVEFDLQKSRLEAKEEAKEITEKAETKAEKILAEAKEEERTTKTSLKKTEERLVKKEDLLDRRQADIDREFNNIKSKIEEVKKLKDSIEEVKNKQVAELERIAKLTNQEAKDKLLHQTKTLYEHDLLQRMQKLEVGNAEQLERKGRELLGGVIQRLASSVTQELTTTSVSIPSDDVKGKIIGKEGRNIRAFERASGVELIIDDTPGTIIISAYDPIRRQIARVALENLISDGRIQPVKIEEFLEKARQDINIIIKKKGEEAVHELGIFDLDPRIVAIIGRLHFRTSYGQNVLQHSIEMAHLASMLAEELGADVNIAKTGALVHDLGKALDHEMQGGHVHIGMRILQKFGADQRVIDAMKSHHDDYPHASIEAVIVQVADMISGSRPGARRDTVENYLKRLKELETVANSFRGVEKTYALQAGREVRVFVKPNKLNDFEAKETAQKIAKRIEEELRYPGEIKVTVIRETRVVEYAR